MNFEQQLLTGMARDQAKLGRDFAACGEVTMARMQYDSAIEKLELAKLEGGIQVELDRVIRELREEISQLGKPNHGQKGSTSVLEIKGKHNHHEH